MGRLTGYRCDICKTETFAYEPPGWRWANVDRKSIKGIQETADRSLMCSDECELVFWQDYLRDLFRTEN